MNCHSVRAVLDLHAEGRLTARRAKAVAAHLDSCPACGATASPAPASSVPAAGRDFKSRLAAGLKAAAKKPAEAPAPALELALWPRDLSGVAFAAAALAVVALAIGWTGVPSQKDMAGEELAGRLP